jgi:hypothetical protein
MTCYLIATGSQNIRWDVNRHKKEPWAIQPPRVSTSLLPQLVGSSVRAAGCRGMECRPDGSLSQGLFTNNSTVNLTIINAVLPSAIGCRERR